MGWNDFSLAAVGCWYENDDGSSRQDELRRCEVGDWLELVREPDNQHDRLAVAVMTSRGVKVGYVAAERAVWIAPKIDRGYDVRAIVQRVKGINLADATLGLLMRINLDGEEPELPAGANPYDQTAWAA